MILVDSGEDIKLRIGDTEASGKVTDQRVVESISTGRELRILKVDVTLTTPTDDGAMATLTEPTQIGAVLHNGPSFHCEARVQSSSYRQGDSERQYSIELQEIEGPRP